MPFVVRATWGWTADVFFLFVSSVRLPYVSGQWSTLQAARPNTGHLITTPVAGSGGRVPQNQISVSPTKTATQESNRDGRIGAIMHRNVIDWKRTITEMVESRSEWDEKGQTITSRGEGNGRLVTTTFPGRIPLQINWKRL